jgi:trimethylamine--corrinoid protein Co-methyltransferase
MNRLNLLSEGEVQAIHEATLRVLGETGIVLTHRRAREMLVEAGARLQHDRVLLPPELVEQQVAKCPPQVRIRGRGGETRTLGDGSLQWHNLGGARDVYEPRSGRHRPAMLQDVRDSARLLDALENATTVTPFFTPQDVPGELMSLAMYRHSLPFTSKPLHGPGVQTAAEVSYAVHLADVVGTPEEILSLSVSPVSPLFFPDGIVDAILETARWGISFAPLPCPTAGTTAPFSIAGALTLQNAEILASIVLAQLVRPELPIVYCGRLAMMEPRTGFSIWGGVEMGLASAGTVQLGHFYHVPVNVYGFSTNAHVLDIQSGYERALNAAIPALAGADELSGIGEMEAGVMGSLAQMVCDDEIAASVRRILRGFPADADALAVEVIAAAMSGPRNFLTEKHTTHYLRGGEILLTHLAERNPWETWEEAGKQGMAERAQSEAERILAEHQVPPLSPEQEQELEDIMAAAELELANN